MDHRHHSCLYDHDHRQCKSILLLWLCVHRSSDCSSHEICTCVNCHHIVVSVLQKPVGLEVFQPVSSVRARVRLSLSMESLSSLCWDYSYLCSQHFGCCLLAVELCLYLCILYQATMFAWIEFILTMTIFWWFMQKILLIFHIVCVLAVIQLYLVPEIEGTQFYRGLVSRLLCTSYFA